MLPLHAHKIGQFHSSLQTKKIQNFSLVQYDLKSQCRGSGCGKALAFGMALFNVPFKCIRIPKLYFLSGFIEINSAHPP